MKKKIDGRKQTFNQQMAQNINSKMLENVKISKSTLYNMFVANEDG